MTKKSGEIGKKSAAVDDGKVTKNNGADSVQRKGARRTKVEAKPQTGTGDKTSINTIMTTAVPSGVDPERPYIIGADGKPLQLGPMDEKIFREDFADEGEKFITQSIFEQLAELDKKVKLKVARSQVDSGVSDRLRHSVPKSGNTIARIEIHMRQVYNNVIGRRNVKGKDDIAGLYSFGFRVNRMVTDYRGSSPCPYAAWYLWRIEQEIAKLRQTLNEYNERVDDLIGEANVGVEFDPFTSSAPTIELLRFHSVHAFQVASVLHQYDQMLRRIWPYVRNHFISQKDFHDILAYATNIRRLFLMPSAWYYVGSDAVTQKTALYQAARERMGDVPQAFLTGETKPEWV